MTKVANERLLHIIVVSVSLLLGFAALEGICRLFPDNQLRYEVDEHALYHFRPFQSGSMRMADGSLSPAAHINEFGFRGLPSLKGLHKPTILVLGDSFTFGSGVSDHETFSTLLNAWMPDKLVVNAGQPGYGVFQMAATLNRVADTFHPILVVVVLWQGDFLRQPPDAAGREAVFRRLRLSNTLKQSAFLTYSYRALERMLLRFGKKNLVVHMGEGGNNAVGDPQSAIHATIRGLDADLPRLLSIHEEARRYGQGVLLVFWPRQDFATNGEGPLSERLTERLSAFATEHGIPFTSVQSAMREMASSSLMIPGDGHPTALTHCIVAQLIALKLVDLQLLQRGSFACSSSSEGAAN